MNSFEYKQNQFYRYYWADDKGKRNQQKKRLKQKFSLDQMQGITSLPTQSYKYDGFTSDSGKLIMCPHTKLIKVNIFNHGLVEMPIPCGKCPYCLHKKQNEWIFRARNELITCKSAFFITLTYAPEHLPEDGEVHKEHVQLWLKRFRKYFNFKVRFRYYCSGEYGSKSYRPHYHLIIFFQDIRPTCKFLSRVIEKTWQKGFIDCKKANLNTICYITKYMQKLKSSLLCNNIDLTEFRLVSKGFGVDWVIYNINQVRSRLTWKYKNFAKNGKEKFYTIGIPRYYKEKVFSVLEKYNKTLDYLGSKMYADKLRILKTQGGKLIERLLYLEDRYNYKAKENLINRIKSEKL